jgi:hypothetical protein
MLAWFRRRRFGNAGRRLQRAQDAADATKRSRMTKRFDVGHLSWIPGDAAILNGFIKGNGMFHNTKSV